jgi:cytochrome c oxidase subunit II
VAVDGDLYAGLQSALNPRGLQATLIDDLWWLFLIVSIVVWVAVVAALWLALWRRNRVALTHPPGDGEPGKRRVVAAATGVTILVLLGLITASVLVGRATTAMPDASRRPLIVEVIGHQWWWEINYLHADGRRDFSTANEIHVPVGRPVIVQTTSRDVIHSFWVPNLAGKMDLLPGRTNTIWFEATHPGEYRGQCAEFCGIQHAKMAFIVVAHPEEAFEEWASLERSTPAPPVDGDAQRGAQVFLDRQCSLCHTIRGTGAWGLVAPDLTHIGSRRTIAAGTLRNTRGNMAGWIADPQGIKPGSHMPATPLAPEDLQALLVYLESLR